MILTVKQREVNAAKIEVPSSARRPRRTSSASRHSSSRPSRPSSRSPRWSPCARRRATRPSAPRRPTSELEKLKAEREADRGADPRAGLQGLGLHRSRDRQRLPRLAGARPVTSPFGWRIHPIYGYRALHDGIDIGAACGTPIRAAGSRQGALGVLPVRVGQPADHRPRREVRRRRRDDLQPPQRLRGQRRASTSSAARSSATSAPPAGRPAATCTSPCWRTASRRPDEVVLSHADGANPLAADLRESSDGQGDGAQARRAEPKARHDYHIEDTFEAGHGPRRHRGEVAAGRPRVPGRRVRRGATTARSSCTACTSRSTPRAPGPTTSRAASASCCSTAPRSTRSTARSGSAASRSSRCRCTSRTAAPRSRSASPRARSPTTSGRPWPSAPPSARLQVGDRPPRQGHGVTALVGAAARPPLKDEDVPGWWQRFGLPGLFDVHVHFLPPRMQAKVWAQFDAAGPLIGRTWPIRYRGSDEERVDAAPRARRTPVLGAVLRTPARDGGVAQRLGAGFAATCRSACGRRRSTPRPASVTTSRRGIAGGRRVQGARAGRRLDLRDPLLDPVWGLLAEAGTPVVIHAGSGRCPRRTLGPGPMRAVLSGTPR